MARVIALIILVLSPAGYAQIFKCTDASGNVGYSDQPCLSTQSSESVNIEPAPLSSEEARDKAALNRREIDERQLERRRAEREKLDQTIAESKAEIAKMKAKHYDPQKCLAARTKMAAIRQRDPITYKANLNYFEYQVAAELYCVN